MNVAAFASCRHEHSCPALFFMFCNALLFDSHWWPGVQAMTVVLFIGIMTPAIFLFKRDAEVCRRPVFESPVWTVFPLHCPVCARPPAALPDCFDFQQRKFENGTQGAADPRGPAVAQVTCSNKTSGLWKDGLEEEDQIAWGLNATDQTAWGNIAITNEGCGCEPSNGTSGGWISNRKGNEAYYANNMRCKWTLESPPNTWFELHFETFETESTFDALHIYSCRDAACTVHTELGTLSGDLEALDSYTYVTSSRFLHLIFVSDNTGVKRGLDLRWTVEHTPAGSKCGGGYAECADRLQPTWSAQHIGIVSALVVCQLFVWCNILRVANQRALDGMEERQDEYLALRLADANLCKST